MMSLTAIGTPCSGPIGRPLRRQVSHSRACASAWSGSRWAKAPTASSVAAMRSRQAAVTSSDETALSAILAATSVAVSTERSAAAKMSLPVEIFRQPKRHARPDVHEDHTHNHDQHVGHHTAEYLVERDVLGRDALEIE